MCITETLTRTMSNRQTGHRCILRAQSYSTIRAVVSTASNSTKQAASTATDDPATDHRLRSNNGPPMQKNHLGRFRIKLRIVRVAGICLERSKRLIALWDDGAAERQDRRWICCNMLVAVWSYGLAGQDAGEMTIECRSLHGNHNQQS